jgi:TrmH family RNA methyltransferase
MAAPVHIRSRDNPLLARVRRLATDPAAYRGLGAFWIEGDHLGRSMLARGWRPRQALVSESGWDDGAVAGLARAADRVAIVADTLFASLSALASPASVGFVVDLPPATGVHGGLPSVVLDRVQDAGNVGSVLRSAAAFGFSQVVALSGTAGLWSPKVLRAAMGAHFGLRLVERLDAPALAALEVPLLVADAHVGRPLPQAELPWPCAWVFGHEGQGVAPALAGRAALTLRIPQPGGEESLNVAAAAAICLYASSLGR